ncbi:Cna B-type domain-containing protein [Lactococcus termiticola]|uniref:von Willebrand factor domain-containing protein n=1 Tax=Lactococcus termiticola TaxID=2169526 RepID=A0A2R5HFN4_9LACT|nr:Cna B-type domain-containing protein [Lactococcus termiticola]GBG96125.1 von Willebrand factor domain-containing protein [Lactococcus termiticola]
MKKKNRAKFWKVFSLGVILLPSVLNFWNLSLSNSLSPRADNPVIQPRYATDEDRADAENSWTLQGQEDVVNHTGNTAPGSHDFLASSTGVNPVGLEDNFTSHYITYPNEDYAMRQFARQTSTPGLYDVFTNVRGNQLRQDEQEKISIVLVADHSASMNDQTAGHNRMYWLNYAINNFTSSLTSIMEASGMSPDMVRIGHVAYGSGIYDTGSRFVNIGNFNSDQQRLLNSATPAQADSGNYTFTQAGLRKAGEMLSAPEEAGRKKVVILLTDGVPTYANAITGASDSNGNHLVDIGEVTATDQNNSGRIVGNSTSRNPLSSNQPRYIDWSQSGVNGGVTARNLVGDNSTSDNALHYNSLFPATIYQADQLKSAGIEVHGIGIALQNGTNNYTYQGQTVSGFSADQIRSNMERLTTNPYFYMNTYDPQELGNYLNRTIMSFFDTVSNGSVQIKIGDGFAYEAGTVSTKYFEYGEEQENSFTASYNDGKINLSQLTLGRGQEIQIHHQVRILTEGKDFQPETWQFISDKDETYFTPSPEQLKLLRLPFAVPSGKAPGTELDVKKVWEDRENAGGERPEQISLQIERKETTADDSWQTASLSLTGDPTSGEWQQTAVKQLTLDGQTVNLPLYNNQGVNFDYQLVGEVGLSSVYTSSFTGMTATNFERWKFDLRKKSDRNSQASGAMFKLSDEAGTVIMVGQSQSAGAEEAELGASIIWKAGDFDSKDDWNASDQIIENFRFELGKTYHLVETEPLPGYRQGGPWIIKVDASNQITVDYGENANREYSAFTPLKDEEDSSFRLTLKNAHDLFNIKGQKIWANENGDESFRPDEITVNLYRNREQNPDPIKSLTVSPDEEGNWSYDFDYWEFTDENGEFYDYKIEESPVSNYNSRSIERENGSNEGRIIDIENTLTPEKMTLPFTKQWVDFDDTAGWRPESITVQLYRMVEGDEAALPVGEAVTVTAEDNWQHNFTDLQVWKSAKERYIYSVQEVDELDHYTATDTSDLTALEPYLEITNSFENNEQLVIRGQKFWNDQNDAGHLRPDAVELQLWRSDDPDSLLGGEQVLNEAGEPVVITTVNDAYQITVPKRDATGNLIHYFVLEAEVPDGYQTPTYDRHYVTTPGDALGTASELVIDVTNSIIDLPIYLDVTKMDADFSSPMSGVNFRIEELGSWQEASEADENEADEGGADIIPLFASFATPFPEALEDSQILGIYTSGEDGRLVEPSDNPDEPDRLIELDFGKSYKVTKLNQVGQFAYFGGIGEWTVNTPTLEQALSHHANQLDLEESIDGNRQLVEKPDEAIQAEAALRDVLVAPLLGHLPLVQTSGVDFRSTLTASPRLANTGPVVDPDDAFVISFNVESNAVHPFSIQKVDGTTNQPMDAQFRLRWVEHYTPPTGIRFDALTSIDVNQLHLSGEGEDAEALGIDATTGATLSTGQRGEATGMKTLNHMARGNLYIISENQAPTGYQRTNTAIVAYMDQEQGYADNLSIHIRLARLENNVLTFGNNRDFPEYRGTIDGAQGIRFANFRVDEAEQQAELTPLASPVSPVSPGPSLPPLGSILSWSFTLLGLIIWSLVVYGQYRRRKKTEV